jgi:hypothetical protein
MEENLGGTLPFYWYIRDLVLHTYGAHGPTQALLSI